MDPVLDFTFPKPSCLSLTDPCPTNGGKRHSTYMLLLNYRNKPPLYLFLMPNIDPWRSTLVSIGARRRGSWKHQYGTSVAATQQVAGGERRPLVAGQLT